jgi:hypothetical protein
MTYDEFTHGLATGVVRMFLGPVAAFGDVFRFAHFMESFVDRSNAA